MRKAHTIKSRGSRWLIDSTYANKTDVSGTEVERCRHVLIASACERLRVPFELNSLLLETMLCISRYGSAIIVNAASLHLPFEQHL